MHILIIAIGLPLLLLGFFAIRHYAKTRQRYYADFISRRVSHRANIILAAEDNASAALRQAADRMADIRAHASRAQ